MFKDGPSPRLLLITSWGPDRRCCARGPGDISPLDAQHQLDAENHSVLTLLPAPSQPVSSADTSFTGGPSLPQHKPQHLSHPTCSLWCLLPSHSISVIFSSSQPHSLPALPGQSFNGASKRILLNTNLNGELSFLSLKSSISQGLQSTEMAQCSFAERSCPVCFHGYGYLHYVIYSFIMFTFRLPAKM